MTNIPNHYGYGLRNDEKPFAHKIPDGGNWRNLNEEDRRLFMKGSLNSGGGRTTYLRRLSWNEPALTILSSPLAKATCQLHPNEQIERSEYMGDFNLTPQLPNNGLTVLELFCGGGLGAIGFKAAGFDIVKALDFDKQAVLAYRHNFGDYVEQADINSVEIGNLPNTDVIFGGPPCQDYSLAGKGEGADGERGKLVFRYLDIIEEKQPKAFVFENVKGLITKKHRATFDALLTKFNEIGYEVSWQLINSWDYGVAQKRERVFIVGIRKDLGITFEFPKPLEGDYQTRVLRDVIGDLPEPFPNHNPKQLSDRVRTRLNAGGYQTYLKKHPMGRLDSPGYSVTAHYAKGAPDGLIDVNLEPRRFTVRECLRIQSVPDSYILPDEISLSAQYRIVGNGIASRVAWYIGKALAEQLKD